jgi:hypothetical protein
MIAVASALADDWWSYISYSGCTTIASAVAEDYGSNDYVTGGNWDYAGCAANVASKVQYHHDGFWDDTGWTIHGTTAVATVPAGYDVSLARANNQIERTSGDWSGFYYSSFLVPD